MPYLVKISNGCKCREETTTNIQRAINYIYVLLGVKTEDNEQNDRDLQTAVLIEFVRDKFGQLTVEEIRNAFKMYVSGELGIKKFRMLDCISASDVLTEYMNIRSERLRIYKSSEKPLFIESISDSKKTEIINSGIVRVFNEYKENRSFGSNLVAYIFDQLVLYGIIFLPKEKGSKLGRYYQEQKEKAKNLLILEAKKNEKISDAKKIIKEIKGDTNSLIEIKTKEIILSQYFDKIIIEDKSIQEILKDK